MKCIIPGINIKVFARAIHSLARIGEELYVEPAKNGVSFRTVDSSKSAFGSFFFKSSFFSLFDFKIKENEGDEENFKCKVVMKACLHAFRAANTIDKSVEKCKLVIDPIEDRLVVNMTCRHGIQKTYNLSFIECETLTAEFDVSTCPFRITSQSRVLYDAFQNFRANQEEVTVVVSPKNIIIRNYVDDDPDPTKTIHTELTLEADEFEEFRIDKTCEITFRLKEVRSLLTFSEPVNLPVSLVFTKPGTPIIFIVNNESIFEAKFVLATFNSQLLTNSLQPSRQSEFSSSMNQMKRPSDVIEEVPRNAIRKRSSEFINDVSTKFEQSKISSPKISHQDLNSSSPKLLNRRNSSSFCLPAPTLTRASRLQDLKASDSKCVNTAQVQIVQDSDEDDVAGTPPAKRRKYYFKRCFEPTFDANNISAFRKILAEDSDEEI